MELESTLTPDTQAVLLLCGELGQRGGNGVKPSASGNITLWRRG